MFITISIVSIDVFTAKIIEDARFCKDLKILIGQVPAYEVFGNMGVI